MVGDEQLRELVERLTGVLGVAGVLLGGSRARGEHTLDSDVDLGLYYRHSLDVVALEDLARDVAGDGTRVTRPGQWGPWVDGGGWLHIAGMAVDWIYRDLDRVHTSWADARAGRYCFHAQVGYPLGVLDFAYDGEVALAVVLADPAGELIGLQQATREYPPRLREALVAGLGEASFVIYCARKAVTRADMTYVAGCLFRAVEVRAHAVHGHAGHWLINEKGAVASAARLPDAPAGFARRAQGILAHLGAVSDELSAAIHAAADLISDTLTACRSAHRLVHHESISPGRAVEHGDGRSSG